MLNFLEVLFCSVFLWQLFLYLLEVYGKEQPKLCVVPVHTPILPNLTGENHFSLFPKMIKRQKHFLEIEKQENI